MSRWPGNAELERTTFGTLSRGQLMSRVRSTGNKTTEQRMLLLLRREKLSGWKRHSAVRGQPDFTWAREKVAVFVDGCFWHGHNCGRNLTPKRNASVWREKIERTRDRDRSVTRGLQKQGWGVVRIWECSLGANPNRCVARIKRFLGKRQGGRIEHRRVPH